MPPLSATAIADVADAGLPDAIRLSHARSAAFGLRMHEAPDAAALSPAALRALLDGNRTLGLHARPVIENLHAQIVGTRSMVVLTDRTGTILHALGDDDFLARAQRVALQPGVAWSEQQKGTNAIGTALAEGEATQVHASQHFLRAHHFLTCSCAPIFDLMGAIDVSGDHRSQNRHTLALVRMSAQMVENQLFARHFAQAVQLHFHARPEFLGTLLEGVAAFDTQGRFLSANRSAQFQLGASLAALQAHTFSSLFGRETADLLAHCRAERQDLLALQLPNGVKVLGRAYLRRQALQWAMALQGGETDAAAADAPPPVHPREPRRPPASAPTAPAPVTPGTGAALSGLHYLRTGDPQLGRVLDRLACLAGRDVPILVLGETGTGKELLARAIHHDSPRRAGPLVAVNCAAIPESLIESELFGYEEGAFTGARRKGSTGRIVQASGGTLFLDEIGDMPLPLQARLLRVLQKRQVLPLGADRPVPVDIAVVCATHRDLRAMRAAGSFRDDLYWRINGLVVRLPALRERTDRVLVAQRLLRAQAASVGRGGPSQPAPHTLGAEVVALFDRHPWPGNIRQMASLLQSAALLAQHDSCIRLEHLPEDFLDDCLPAFGAQQAAPGVRPTRGTPSREDAAPVRHSVQDCRPASLQERTADTIAQALQMHGGNVSATARALGIARNTVYRHLRQTT